MYDVIVIGAGHAGCEAGLAAARQGVKTLIITINMDSVASMPCNSAIGGPGRGQLIREIDVLGGEISKNTDRNYIHMRMLNVSKGPAVQTLRAIVDKKRYFLNMKYVLENENNLDLKQGLAKKIIIGKNRFTIQTSDKFRYKAKCLVICTGTFLRGEIFWGKNRLEAGRKGEISSISLVESLEEAGYRFSKLKTDTPPRVDKKTLNLKELKVQEYDKKPKLFSYESKRGKRKQVENYITYAEKKCINYIKKNIRKSAFYGKKEKKEGPKYCPSIEEKVMRFPERARHLIFIQPEGLETNEMYLHGLMTTLPEDIQYGILKRIKGTKDAIITRHGYGVEYDYLKSFQINNTLESKSHSGLFFAGQINGTTGYDEAAAQGIVGGINAARRSQGEEGIVIKREDGYIGVLIDDLVVKGITEPYRMLTSRNEFRLHHRHDNVDYRMAKFLPAMGLSQKQEKILKKYKNIEIVKGKLKFTPFYNKIKKNMLSDNDLNYISSKYNLSEEEAESVVIKLKYEDYIKREEKKIRTITKNMDVKIPDDICYSDIHNLSNEATKSLNNKKPQTLEQAKRIEGVSLADIFSLLCYIKNVSRETME